MTDAGIYCRVSGESQERDGTSLQTQMEACKAYCQQKGYDAAYKFSETFSGLTLERPLLGELRELIRDEKIDVVVAYSLDRLSRDPTHGVILTQEMEKYGVKLETVTEDVDNSELGKLISYIRGFASKLEAEKIKERTLRGRRARAKEGRAPGNFHFTYGYDYVPVSQKDGGKRVINEGEAKWVRQIFNWLVDDGMTTAAIRNKLNESGVHTKRGNRWRRSAVLTILKNPAYAGKTYAFTHKGTKPYAKPREEWIELPGFTPALISETIFEDAQRRLKRNAALSQRNTKRQYLLRGHVRCERCGLSYTGGTHGKKLSGGDYRRIYTCNGKSKDLRAGERCNNKRWNATKLENYVWKKLEETLKNEDLIINEYDKIRNDADQIGVFEKQLKDTELQLRAVEREQHQLLQWALKGFPEAQVESENKRLNKARETLNGQITDLHRKIKAGKEATINVPL